MKNIFLLAVCALVVASCGNEPQIKKNLTFEGKTTYFLHKDERKISIKEKLEKYLSE